METKEEIKVIDPLDNDNFQKGLNELAEQSGKPSNARKYIDEPADQKKPDEEDAFNSAL